MEQCGPNRLVKCERLSLFVFNVDFLGVPHTAIEDGLIAGYFIPKGSLILANLWLASRPPFL